MILEQHSSVESLMLLWKELIPTFVPLRTQFVIWVETHGSDIVRYGLIATGKKYVKLNGNMSEEYLLRYASRCMSAERGRRKHSAREPVNAST